MLKRRRAWDVHLAKWEDRGFVRSVYNCVKRYLLDVRV